MIVSKQLIGKVLPKIYQVDDASFIKACNSIGIEVERILKHPTTNNLVIGQLIKIEQHPNADKLHVCQVKIDDSNNFNTIVCGANNLVVNKKVVVALSGAKLHDGRVIEYKELRGVLSQGMICAYGELTPYSSSQTDEDKNGIMLLDDAIVGDKDIAKYIGLDDTIYDLTLPSNRNDLNAVLSLAQELAGYFKWEYKWPEIKDLNGSFKEDIKIERDKTLCQGFIALKIRNINLTSSNWLTKALLMNNGVKPLNKTLDELAYITLLTNASTAVYDANLMTNEIKICRANSKEKFIGFDSKEYTLNINDIVIKNQNNIIGLAGIMGSKEFGINKNTKDIIVEVANFYYVNIRNTNIHYDINTDAAKRFSKPMSNYLQCLATYLIYQRFNGFQISDPIIDMDKVNEVSLTLDVNFINKILGVNLQLNAIQQNLIYYGFKFENDKCIVPLHRIDIVSSQDISEEVTKFLDVNELPSKPIVSTVENSQRNIEYELLTKVKSILNENYFTEVHTYNLTNQESLNEFNVFKYNKFIRIENSNNKNREYLRTNLIQKLLDVYELNLSYKTQLQPIFEIQKIYTETYQTNLTVISTDTIYLDYLEHSKIVVNVNTLRAIAEQIAKAFNTTFEFFTTTNESKTFYPNELLAIHCYGKLIGYIGLIKNTKTSSFKIFQNVYCLTINLDLLIQLYQESKFQYSSITKLMPIYKDVSFIIHPSEKIINLLKALKELPFIESFEFIDRYILSEEQISYTLRFRFYNQKGLDSKAIDQYLKEIELVMIQNHTNVRK